jgi:hypothetical protein
MPIRPYDQSLALETLARGDATAFQTAVLDRDVREYLVSQRESPFEGIEVYTVAWANGFLRNQSEFVRSIKQTGESPSDLAILAGLPPAGMEIVDAAARGATSPDATPERLAAYLSSRTGSLFEIEVLRDVLDISPDVNVYSALLNRKKSPLEVLIEKYDAEYDGNLSHLFVHLAYRRLTGSSVTVKEVIRLNALGLIDPVTLEHAAAEDWPDEYASALDSDR